MDPENLETQPPSQNTDEAIREWPPEEQKPSEAQKVLKFITDIEKFSGDDGKFDSWWRSLYTTLQMRELGHHLLVKEEIPAAEDNDMSRKL